MGRARDWKLFDPRKLRPGQVITLARDEYGFFKRARFELSPEKIVVFEATTDSLLSYYEEVDCSIRLRKFEGVVESSFDRAESAMQ